MMVASKLCTKAGLVDGYCAIMSKVPGHIQTLKMLDEASQESAQ